MAVILTPGVSTADIRTYLHSEHQIDCIEKDPDLGEDCGICFLNCNIPMLQFIDTGDVDNPFSNDFFAFILTGFTNGSIEATFENLSNGGTETLIDNSFGTLNEQGDYLERPLVWSFTTDWHAIHAAHGFGEYRFRFKRKNGAGNVITDRESVCFRLCPWDCEMAHDTVVIETLQTGIRPLIEGGFDYTGIKPTIIINGFPALAGNGWRQRVRWYGKFTKTTPETITDTTENNQRGQDQLQTQIIDKYNLRLDFIKADVSDQIIYDNFLANKIEITDYNVDNPDQLIRKRVVLETIDEMEPMHDNRERQILTTFAIYKQNILKRNV